MNLLRPVAVKWELFCVQLGVPHTEVKLIAADPLKLVGGLLACFQHALSYWLQQPRSISLLCDALRSEVIDEEVLATEVEAKLKARKGKVFLYTEWNHSFTNNCKGQVLLYRL